MDKLFDDIRNYLAQNYELVALFATLFFIFFLYSVFKGHSWVYNNRIAIKTGINELPQTAQKWIWFCFGLFWLAVSLFATVGLYLKKFNF